MWPEPWEFVDGRDGGQKISLRTHTMTRPGGLYVYKSAPHGTPESTRECNTRTFACCLAWGTSKSTGNGSATRSALKQIGRVHDTIIKNFYYAGSIPPHLHLLTEDHHSVLVPMVYASICVRKFLHRATTIIDNLPSTPSGNPRPDLLPSCYRLYPYASPNFYKQCEKWASTQWWDFNNDPAKSSLVESLKTWLGRRGVHSLCRPTASPAPDTAVSGRNTTNPNRRSVRLSRKPKTSKTAGNAGMSTPTQQDPVRQALFLRNRDRFKRKRSPVRVIRRTITAQHPSPMSEEDATPGTGATAKRSHNSDEKPACEAQDTASGDDDIQSSPQSETLCEWPVMATNTKLRTPSPIPDQSIPQPSPRRDECTPDSVSTIRESDLTTPPDPDIMATSPAATTVLESLPSTPLPRTPLDDTLDALIQAVTTPTEVQPSPPTPLAATQPASQQLHTPQPQSDHTWTSLDEGPPLLPDPEEIIDELPSPLLQHPQSRSDDEAVAQVNDMSQQEIRDEAHSARSRRHPTIPSPPPTNAQTPAAIRNLDFLQALVYTDIPLVQTVPKRWAESWALANYEVGTWIQDADESSDDYHDSLKWDLLLHKFLLISNKRLRKGRLSGDSIGVRM